MGRRVGTRIEEGTMALESVCQRSRLRALLGSLEEPCWVLTTEGRVLVRNEPGRAEPGGPPWVMDFIEGRSCVMPIGARARFIAIDGEAVIFATDRTHTAKGLFDFEALGLDELHQETAHHLLRDFSENEIALLLGRSVITVHTIIVSVYRQLGVRNRAELVAFTQRVRRSNLPPARPSMPPMTIVETRPMIAIEMDREPHPYVEMKAHAAAEAHRG